MRIDKSTFAILLASCLLTQGVQAQEIVRPDCAALAQWTSPLTEMSESADADELQRQSAQLREVFSDQATELAFGLGYSRWSMRSLIVTQGLISHCRKTAAQEGDTLIATRLEIVARRISGDPRFKTGNSVPAAKASPPKIRRASCEQLQTWTDTLMSDKDMRLVWRDPQEHREQERQQRSKLLANENVVPLFGVSITDWNSSDFAQASADLQSCWSAARDSGDSQREEKLRRTFGFLQQVQRQMSAVPVTWQRSLPGQFG